MRQLGIDGEIQWPAQQSGPFAFQASRPGLVVDVKADLEQGRATVQRNQLNAWGVMHLLHTFTGVRAGDARNARDWTLTTLWALSMDAVAIRPHRDGLQQLRHVVSLEDQATGRGRRPAARFPQLRRTRCWAVMVSDRSRQVSPLQPSQSFWTLQS